MASVCDLRSLAAWRLRVSLPTPSMSDPGNKAFSALASKVLKSLFLNSNIYKQVTGLAD